MVLNLLVTFFYGAIFLTLCFLMFFQTKKVNVLNIRYLFLLLWTCVIFLYNLQLSSFYKPSFTFNLILLVFLLSFSVFTGMIKSPSYLLCCEIFKTTKKNINNYSKPMIFLFIIGLIANIYEIYKVGAPIMLENKVSRGEVLHYTHYLTNLTSIAIALAYVVFRFKKNFLSLIIIIIGILSLIVWLNRGSLLLLFLTIGVFELWRSIVYKKFKKMLIFSAILGTIFVAFFGYIGNLRVEYVMKNIFKHSINAHYGMSESFPSELCQVYIYASSPLENARHMIIEQDLKNYEYGINILYPFIAPLVKQLFINRIFYYPYLDDLAGLNVSTFIDQALLDFGLYGMFIIYPFAFAVICIITTYAIKKHNEMTIIVFISAIHLLVWSIFVNPFNNGTFVIDLIVGLYLFLSPKVRLFHRTKVQIVN